MDSEPTVLLAGKVQLDPENREKVLVVEDEPDMLQGIRRILKKQGYNVETASDGIRAMQIVKENAYPVALLDLKLPGVDGFEIMKEIKERSPESEVIIMTGYGDMDSAITALKLDASDFIPKPFKTEAVTLAIRRAFNKIQIKRKLKEYTSDLEGMVRAATEEIVRRREFESKLIQSSIDGIVAADDEGTIVIYNQAAENLLGYTKAETLQKLNVRDIYPGEIADEIVHALRSGDSHLTPIDWKETTIVNKSGERIPVRFSGNVIREKGKTFGSVGFFHDLRQLKKLEQELIQSERLAAIGQTTAGIAHYVKNILNGLKGGIYVANDALEKNDMEKFRTGWDMLQKNVQRITQLVNDFLYYSKDRDPDYETVSPNEIAEDVLALMESRARDYGVTLIPELDVSLPPIPVDPNGIHNALLNLVSNAIDACAETEKENLEVRLKTSRQNGELRYEVSDNGMGMDDEVRKKLFSSFFSTKGGRGTGLGLLMTQKIIQEHHGSVSADSKKGVGSTFRIRLPYSKPGVSGGKP